MKQFKKLVAGIAFVVLALSTVPRAQAQSYNSEDFIGTGGGGVVGGWNGFLQIGIGSTYSYAGTNVFAKGFYQTNILTAITNAYNGLVITGYVSAPYPNWVTNTSAISDAPLWANRDGTAPIASISADINGYNLNGTADTTFTNIVTFNFVSVPRGGFGGVANTASAVTLGGSVQPTAAQDQWSFSMTGNGTTDVVLVTNVPTTLLQGNRSLRLASVVTTNVGTNGQVVYCSLQGYLPNLAGP